MPNNDGQVQKDEPLMACGKTLTGQEDIMNALCKYYAAVSGLGHQEGCHKKRRECTDVDLLVTSRRANQQQNCRLNWLQLALAFLKPGKTAGPDPIFLKNHIHFRYNLSTSPRGSCAC
jgi:hypothetical protein